jgi:DNA-binding NarL/FixJ family response regulator
MSEGPAPLSVAVVEDDPKVRALVVRTITAEPDLRLVSEHATGEDAAEALIHPNELRSSGHPGAAARIDVVVVDLQLPGIDGIEVVRRLGATPPTPERLMLTAFASEEKVFEAIRAGAAGCLLKRDVPGRLPAAIREVAAGGTVIEPRLARRFWNLFESQVGRAPADPWGLTDAERDVLRLVARGLTNREAGGVLGRTPRQVKLELERVFAKMSVTTRVDAVTAALRAGVIELP